MQSMKKPTWNRPDRLRISVKVQLTLFAIALLVVLRPGAVLAQTPTPTPDTQDKRGLGVKSPGATSASTADRGQREAKPELIMQTGYNNFFGATRLVFSPDGRLLATTTFRSSTVKLWDTTNGRELRDLSSGGQNGLSLSPVVCFFPHNPPHPPG